MSKCIFWFRKDLRLKDNTALNNALKNNDEVIPVYIIDPSFINSSETGDSKIKFIFDSLKDLSEKLNQAKSRLIIRFGKSDEQIIKLAQELEIKKIYFNKIYDSSYENSDEKIIPLFEDFGLEISSFKDNILFDKEDLDLKAYLSLTNRIINQNDFQKNFKVYKRLWKNRFKKINLNTISKIQYEKLTIDKSILSLAVPSLEDYGISVLNLYPLGGETKANKILFESIQENNFISKWDILKPYLEIGNISIRQILNNAKLNNIKLDRDISNEKSYNYLIENIILENYLTFYNIDVNDPKIQDQDNSYNNFLACCRAQTGLPVIDACLTQINKESLLNSKIFSYVLNILINDLSIDPLWISNYLNNKLVNTSNIFYKIIMTNQSSKIYYDKSYISEYIKHYLPVLKNVPEKFIENPDEMPVSMQSFSKCIIGKDYPYPILDKNFYQILEI